MTTNKPVDSGDEYSLNADMSGAVSGTGVAIPLTAGVDVYFRTKATSSSFISKIQRLEVEGAPTAPAAPSYEVNYINKRTNKVVPNTEEYSENSDMSSATTGSGAYVTVTPGTNLYFRVKAANGQPASDIFELVVPDKPAAPAAFSINFQNETTQGNVPNTMEYSTSSNFSNAVTGSNTVVNVQPGTTLYIRYKATSNAFESEVRQLAVPARPSAPNCCNKFH
ncbi:MAG: hypothetical protein HC830_12935 [Bacteroidetes bacterium]|nr:hypothetical protein [Bacteroidota bacterium]